LPRTLSRARLIDNVMEQEVISGSYMDHYDVDTDFESHIPRVMRFQ
jgi:hypothetical protein